ncbi:conjugal transfer protein MobB [Flavobacterium plurextorum]|uniref:conjugal transfer protein MobB n=1 Tax=Flavobacterium TaxID=237 RepID=UPI00351A3451
MIAKIGRSGNLYGALAYNQQKVENKNAKILSFSRIIETPDAHYSAAQLMQSFAPYLIANRNTEKHTLHISLNPDPKDQVSDSRYIEMADQYMREMGYGQQPYVVFKHTDIERSHIHIVSVCVDEQGKKISDSYEKIRSMKLCRELETKYGLIRAAADKPKQENTIFQAVDYKKGNIKSQMASVVRYLPQYYSYQSLGEYNALLSLFNIQAQKLEVEHGGIMRQGLLYAPLDEKGEKAGHPIKASLFGKKAGMAGLELHFGGSRKLMDAHPAKKTIKAAITDSFNSAKDEQKFIENLGKHGINVVVRRNDAGRIYGMTFVDHNSKTVWNGSRLGKEFSANIFNNCWNSGIKTEMNNSNSQLKAHSLNRQNQDMPAEKPHQLFSFIDAVKKTENIFDVFAGLLPINPDSGHNDYTEPIFKKKIRRRKK